MVTTPASVPEAAPSEVRPASGAVSESVLIARAQAGDHGAFEAIFNQYQTAIFNYIYRLMSSSEDAYDLTQDTFLKAYLALPKTSDDLRVGAWLYRIATNVCLDELRHRKLVRWQPWEAFILVFHPSQVAKDNPEHDAIDRENTEEVQLILEKLHPKYRVCLILREYHDLSYDEIADILVTTRAAVKSLLFRAREEFRQIYAKIERQPGRAKGDRERKQITRSAERAAEQLPPSVYRLSLTSQRFCAKVWHDRVRLHLGTFDTVEEAVAAVAAFKAQNQSAEVAA